MKKGIYIEKNPSVPKKKSFHEKNWKKIFSNGKIITNHISHRNMNWNFRKRLIWIKFPIAQEKNIFLKDNLVEKRFPNEDIPDLIVGLLSGDSPRNQQNI